jgi:transposase
LVQRTHAQEDEGRDTSDASRLLDLEGLAVERIESDAFGGRVVHVVTRDEAASACPSCGVFSSSLKGRVATRPRDIPYGTTALRLVWHKRRWRCTERLCPRGSFTEQVGAVPARARLTRRLRAELGAAVAEQRRCVAETAACYGVGWRIVHAAYVAHVQAKLAEPLPPVRVLGIDETRRGKPVWKRDEASGRWVLACDRWHTGFVDAIGTGGLLAQVEGRSAAVVTAWLNDQPQAWREHVTHVAIDLSASYAKAVRDALPHAVLVADRFHLVRLGNDTLTAVRQRVLREHEGRRGRKIDPAWRARRRLLTAHERVSPEAFARMWNALVDTGDPGWQQHRSRARHTCRSRTSRVYRSTVYRAHAKLRLRTTSSSRSSTCRGSSGAPAPRATGAYCTHSSSSSPASANCPARSPPPTTHTPRSPAAATMSACGGATAPWTKRMSPRTCGSCRVEKTHVGSSYGHDPDASPFSSCSRIQRYVVEPIANAPTDSSMNRSYPIGPRVSMSRESSQDSECSGSAMKPSTLDAVK